MSKTFESLKYHDQGKEMGWTVVCHARGCTKEFSIYKGPDGIIQANKAIDDHMRETRRVSTGGAISFHVAMIILSD